MEDDIAPSLKKSGLLGRIAQRQVRGGPARMNMSDEERVLEMRRLTIVEHEIMPSFFELRRRFGDCTIAQILSRERRVVCSWRKA
jgi:hypothetical protein